MSTPEGRSIKVLSCTCCRERKTKCDKVQPFCTQCSRAGLQCAYPSRKPTRRAPRPRQRELLDRISRLESIVGSADPDKLQQLDDAEVGLTPGDSAAQPSGRASAPASGEPADAATRYLSGEFWSNLCDEVEGIKYALDEPSDEEDDDDDGDTPESVAAAAARPTGPGPAGSSLLANPDSLEKNSLIHPPPDVRARLWAIYVRNVDPLMKILHRPSIERELDTICQAEPHSCMNAVLFSVYFAAATSLSPETCMSQLGEGYNDLLFRYRTSAEYALAAADYLNSTDLRVLQAFAIYVSILRLHTHGRSSWALTSLLIRLAQGINLHRDNDGRRFSPFEAEMRRRLWHFIIVLDIRAAEDRGTDAIIARNSWNTAVPTPINDEDFSPSSTGPLQPKHDGPADNVVLMCTSMCSGFLGYLQHPATTASGESHHFIFTEDDLFQHVRRLENDFIHVSDPSHLPSRYASEIARLVVLKLWLVIQYPFSALPSAIRPRVSRETMLRTAVSVMELSERMSESPWAERFAWWTATYPQWHPLAVALAELCVQTRGDLVERSWTVVDRTFAVSRHRVADSYSGTLWRPIRKLHKRAKAARAESLMQTLSLNEASSVLPPQPPAQPNLQLDPLLEMPPQVNTNVPTTTQPYEPINMDPSYLFEYPQELSYVDFNQFGGEATINWSPWNDFLNDTQMDLSPEGSGSASGSGSWGGDLS